MARLGVTYTDVANAANHLLGQNRAPTIELIRNVLGTGSTTTIANHLRQWRLEQDGTTSVAAKEQLPQEFIALMKGLWQRIQAHAAEQITQAQQISEQIITQLRQEAEKYKNNNQRWQKMHDVWLKEKDTLMNEKSSLEQTIGSLTTDHAALLAKLDTQHHQLDEKQERINELHRLHQQAQENLDHFRESMRIQRAVDEQRYEQQLNHAESLVKNMEQQLAVTTHEKTTLQSQLDQIKKDQIILQKSYEGLNVHFTNLQSQYTSLEKDHTKMKQNAALWQQQNEQLEKNIASQGAALLDYQMNNAVLNQQLSAMNNEVQELKDKNKLLAHEKWEIAQEKAQLEGINKQMQKMIYPKEAV